MNICELCGTPLIDNCYVCGAPVCCPKCCEEDNDMDRKIDVSKIKEKGE